MDNISKCNFHLYLGKKDYEILLWKNSLPPKCFKFYVEQILLSYINGYKIALPPAVNKKSVTIKYAPVHIIITNEQVAEFLNNINSGDKSKAIKEIILYYIRESQDAQFVGANKKNKKKQTPPSYQTPSKNTKPTTVTVSTQSAANTNKPAIEVQLTREPLKVNDNKTQNKNNKKENASPEIKENKPIDNQKEETIENKPTKNNPMLQSLFRMSGDE